MVNKITVPGAGPIVRAWSELFCRLSGETLPVTVAGVDQNFQKVLEVVYQGNGWPPPAFTEPTKILFRPAVKGPENRVLVDFTGGKDSTAAAVLLRAQGYDVTLFYVKGLNSASYAGEHNYAARVADALGLQMVQVDVRQEGRPGLPDNPVKNQFILALMVEYGIRNGIAVFAQGNLGQERIAETRFGYTTTDGRELYEAAGEWFRGATTGGFRFLMDVLEYESDSFVALARNAPDVMPVILSCIAPYRHRARIRASNEKKFGVVLREQCCGTCYKCATEYLHRVLLGLEAENKKYAYQCVQRLREAHQKMISAEVLPPASESLDYFIEKTVLSYEDRFWF